MDASDDTTDLQNTTYSLKWRDIPGSWPRRLLHIPTMVSLQRQEANVYGQAKEPRYGILTYTWGRWERQDGPRLKVAGTTWPIPSIDEEHFNTENFERVIRRMGQDVEFAWIDVACIDQVNLEVKMDEIRNQVSIFANARRVYVWFSSLSTDTLTGILGNVFDCETHLYTQDTQALNKSIPDALDDLFESLVKLFRDPWFSSLWTLQEGTLRRDALVLSQNGSAIPLVHTPALNVYLGIVFNAFFHLKSATKWSLSQGNDEIKNISNKIIDLIQKAGYDHSPFSKNPNIQYSAARQRTTSKPLDRIYGIMAIYGINVGTNYEENKTFENLEHEFAVALNKYSPRLGQAFIHTSPPKTGCTWKLTQQSRVPVELGDFDKDSADSCIIFSNSSNGVSFNGPTCSLVEILKVWSSRMKYKSGTFNHFYWFQIRLDNYIPGLYPSLPSIEDLEFDLNSEIRDKFLPLGDALLNVFGRDRVFILRLGDYPEGTNDNYIFGLVLLRSEPPGHEYQRLGICKWQDRKYNDVGDPDWKDTSGKIQ